MTREEAKALLGSTALLMFEHNGSSTLDGDKTLHIIDKIFDEHYLEMKAKDEEIERLKEFEEMVEWMELNSNRSLCDYYNNKDNS